MFSNFIVYSTNKTLDYVDIELLQLPNLTDNLITADGVFQCTDPLAINYNSGSYGIQDNTMCLYGHNTEHIDSDLVNIHSAAYDASNPAGPRWTLDETTGAYKTCGVSEGTDYSIEYTDYENMQTGHISHAVRYNSDANPLSSDTYNQYGGGVTSADRKTLAFETIEQAKTYYISNPGTYDEWLWYFCSQCGCNKFKIISITAYATAPVFYYYVSGIDGMEGTWKSDFAVNGVYSAATVDIYPTATQDTDLLLYTDPTETTIMGDHYIYFNALPNDYPVMNVQGSGGFNFGGSSEVPSTTCTHENGEPHEWYNGHLTYARIGYFNDNNESSIMQLFKNILLTIKKEDCIIGLN